MPRLAAFAALMLALCAPANAGAPELFAKAATVKVYMYDADPEKNPGILRDFRTVDPTAVPRAGVALDARQIARVKKTFTVASGDQALGGCFVPRHGFVFEDAHGQVIGTLDVCFECTNYSVNAPGYNEKVQPIYNEYAKLGDWNRKLERKQQADVDKLRATFDMPPADAPVDWKGLETLLAELGMPAKPKPADYERLRNASN